jgi:hypothetical protein
MNPRTEFFLLHPGSLWQLMGVEPQHKAGVCLVGGVTRPLAMEQESQETSASTGLLHVCQEEDMSCLPLLLQTPEAYLRNRLLRPRVAPGGSLPFSLALSPIFALEGFFRWTSQLRPPLPGGAASKLRAVHREGLG